MKYLFECGVCRKTTEIDIKLENVILSQIELLSEDRKEQN